MTAPIAERGGGPRQVAFAALVAATTGLIAVLTWDLLAANGMEVLEYPIFVLSIVLAAPIVTSFWLAVAGALAEWHRAVPAPAEPPATAPLARTAIVMPIHNEDPQRVGAALRATWESLAATGELESFHLFVLSDTTDPQRWLDEEIAIGSLRAVLPAPERVTYRHRAENTDRKVGNIRDFCRRWGDRFECMVVLDADSVMSGTTLVRLAQMMQIHPRAGILQVPPLPVNGASLFARTQQFAASAYGATWASGLAWLQLGDGNYYGHNAIVRIRPFVEDCVLPRLSGAEPLGGAILSHDFVEAALMRRAGHTIHLLPRLGGSYEESPPTLIDHANRDRRWCQGNLQHSRLLGMRGLRAMSRTHMLMGIMAYASAPLWLLLMLLWTAHAVRSHFVPHQYFAPSSLFPLFQTSVASRALLLLTVILSLLFVPRLVAVLLRLRDRDERRGYGGAVRTIASFVAECMLSMLLAPALMLEHTRAVIGILCGRTTSWRAQRRGDAGVSPREAMRRYGFASALGAAWAALLWSTSRETLWWMLPALLGLVFAAPLAALTGSSVAGAWARRRGLLATPAETEPEPVLERFRALVAAEPPASDRGGSALERLLRDAPLRRLHESLSGDGTPTDPLAAHSLEGLELKCRLEGAASLSKVEQRALMGSPAAVRRLAEAMQRGESCSA